MKVTIVVSRSHERQRVDAGPNRELARAASVCIRPSAVCRLLCALCILSWLFSALPAPAAVIINSGTFSVGGSPGDNNNLVTTNNVTMTSGAVLVGAATGGGTGGNDNTVIISNSTLTATVASFIGAGSSNNSVTILGGTTWTNTAGNDLILGNGGGGFNSLTITNATLFSNAGTIGWGSANNTVTVLSNGIWNLQGAQKLNVGADSVGASANNTLIINGGIVTNFGVTGTRVGLVVGGNAGGDSNRVLISNGGKLFVDGIPQFTYNVRLGQVSRNNQIMVTDTGSVFSASGPFIIGESGGTANSLIVSNGARVTIGGILNINSSSNSVVVTSPGSLLSINDLLRVGNVAGSSNNVTVADFATLRTVGASIGGAGGASHSNSLLVANGAVWTNTGTAISLGNNGNFNRITLTNGAVVINSAALTIGAGSGANGNSVAVLGSGSVLSNATTLEIGNATAATNNSLQIADGAKLFSGNLSVIGSNNSYAVGGMGLSSFASNGTIVLGSGGVGFNRMTLTNATLLSNDGTIGWASASNTVVVLSGATWNLHGANKLNVGSDGGLIAGPAANNALIINGGIVTNIGLNGSQVGIVVGGNAGGDGNRVVISNGGGLFVDGPGISGYNFRIGQASQNNQVLISDTGSVLSVSAGLIFGEGSGSANSLIVSNGALATIRGQILARGAGNLITIIGTNSTLITGGALQLGNAAGHNNNAVLVADGALLQATAFTIGAGTGNTISNRNGTYQFTNAPTAITAGAVAITDGTISFRATSAANVATNAANLIRNIRYAGTNTFTLNNASNTTAGVSQTYTFNAIAGNPSNFVNLVMVNGTTAYGNANGANITIGSAGSMLVSNTTATISGLLTNTGSLSVVNAQATFQQRVYNSGTIQMLNSSATFSSGAINTGHWITDPTTNIFNGFGLTNAASGAIQMAAGDVYIFNNTVAGTPANFINVSTNQSDYNTLEGKMLFSGGLGLTQTVAVAGHDLGPAAGTATNIVYASSGAPGFVNNFALGTLEVSNFSTVRVTDAFLEIGTNDFLTAGLYLENLFLGVNSLLIIDTNVQVYFKNSNAWSLANIRLVNNQGMFGDEYSYDNTISGLHQIAIIPEPSVLLLCTIGFVTVWARRRKRQA